MLPVFMVNDVGGIVYVGKNAICIQFAVGISHEFRINTKELLERLEQKKPGEIETKKYLIDTLHKTPDGVNVVTILIKISEQDEDLAVVTHWDLVEALINIEHPFEKISFE